MEKHEQDQLFSSRASDGGPEKVTGTGKVTGTVSLRIGTGMCRLSLFLLLNVFSLKNTFHQIGNYIR